MKTLWHSWVCYMVLMAPASCFVPRLSGTSRETLSSLYATTEPQQGRPSVAQMLRPLQRAVGCLGLLTGGTLAPLSWQMTHLEPAQAKVIMLPRCEGGQGDGCEAMAEGNEFVRQLQQRSATNYEASMKNKLQKYNYNNFEGYFSFRGQVLLIRPDGRFIAINKDEAGKLEKEGKIQGNRWVSEEEPPAASTDYIPSTWNQ